MDRDKLVDLLFDKGKNHRIDEMEIYINKTSSVNFNIYQGELEEYVLAEDIGLSLRGIYNGKMGYAYTEKPIGENLDELLDNLIQYANENQEDSMEVMFSNPTKGNDLVFKENLLNKYSDEEKVDYLLDLEQKVYDLDKRIEVVNRCSYNEKTENIYITNTKGVELESSHTIGMINLGVVAKEGINMQTGYSHHMFDDLKEEYKEILIKDSVGDSLMNLGARSIKSTNYNVILRNNVAADMFSNFLPVFLGDNVQKGLSLMKGKIDTKVAVDSLSIIEDPLMENGKYYRSFDDEGTLTNKKHIIKNGVLKTFLHNNRTSKKEDILSTGNGFKNSHKSSIGIVATNMYIEEGKKSLDDMYKSMRDGVIITEVEGLHAGINPTSGSFSLSSKGILVENGEITRPISQITIAGNLYEMLENINDIGNDTKFCHPNSNYFGSPSISVGELTIAGE